MAVEETGAPDPVALTQELVRCPSVTPAEAGALELLSALLQRFGFVTERVDRAGVPNLAAQLGTGPRVFGFNGHTDVVPTGDAASWSQPPFSGAIVGDEIWGRGATDMKSGVAAFVSAACAFAADGKLPKDGALLLLITGDEEGPGLDGTRALLDWMAAKVVRMEACLVGEPTSRAQFGDVIKIGRRGSLHVSITARGKPGHVAYPSAGANPLPPLVRLLDDLARTEIDQGSAHFGPSTLQITTIDTGNPTTNMTPAEARAALNIRFNDLQSEESLRRWIEDRAHQATASAPDVEIDIETRLSGPAFVTVPGRLTDIVSTAIEDVTGAKPRFETGGGTSDARFIQAVCPVVEFGLRGLTMHEIDERVSISEIRQLTDVYARVLEQFFTT